MAPTGAAAPIAPVLLLFCCLEALLTGVGGKGGTGAAGVAFAKSPVNLGCLGVTSLPAGAGLLPPMGALGTFV